MDKILFFGLGYILGKSGTGGNGPIIKIDDKGVNILGYPVIVNEKSKTFAASFSGIFGNG